MSVRLGLRGIRVRLPANVDRKALVDGLRSLDGIDDVALGGEAVAIVGSPAARDAAIAWIRESACAPARAESKVHVIRVRYDGPDLESVARHAQLPIADIARLHASARYRVAFFGFVPGFAYLEGLPEALRTPRRSTPRARVEAGSVAIGGPYTGVYPFASPGGWNLIGSAESFDPDALDLGDEIRFEVAP